MQALPSPARGLADARRSGVLDAAVHVFARYGFRKASMDDVARAAGVSRQGLYLQFENKETLFRESLTHTLTRQLQAAAAELSTEKHGLEVRLGAACDAWCGRFVAERGSEASDPMWTSTSWSESTLALYEAQFEAMLSAAIAESSMARCCARLNLHPADLARALHATARGLVRSCKTRQEFAESITVAARLFCAPLDQRIGTGVLS